jgi:NAD(P)-dependent dehydrogenase (short-subunit alcohol dehydrogenase family)
MLAQALHEQLAGGDRTGCVVNLLDQKLWNPNPDYFSYTLSKAALQAATVMLAQALAPRVRVCGVAPGVTLVSGPMDEREFAQAHAMTPLQRSSTPLPRRVAGDHRDHAAGRWRPAPAGASARRALHREPGQGALIAARAE